MMAATGRRSALAALTVGGLAALSGLAVYQAGFRLNVTPSVPLGLWRVHPARHIVRGDVVTLCVPDSVLARTARSRGYFMSGACPGDFMPLIKPIAALAGDRVTISARGVSINGALLPDSQALDTDTKGRRLVPAFVGERQVPAGMMFVLSSFNRLSFDSRYFGMVPVNGVQSAGAPVWVTNWKPKER